MIPIDNEDQEKGEKIANFKVTTMLISWFAFFILLPVGAFTPSYIPKNPMDAYKNIPETVWAVQFQTYSGGHYHNVEFKGTYDEAVKKAEQ